MKKMKRALRLMRMTCNYVSSFNVDLKIQKNIGFICTCRILVCDYVRGLKYMVFKCFNKKLISLNSLRIIALSGVYLESMRSPQGLTWSSQGVHPESKRGP